MTNIHRYENIAAKHQDFHVAQDQFGSEESKFEVKNDLHFQFRSDVMMSKNVTPWGGQLSNSFFANLITDWIPLQKV